MNSLLQLPPWWPTVRPAVYVLAWIPCLWVAGARLHHARTEYDPPATRPAEWTRPHGNDGHAHIDFGGQWVMGRMVATGHAGELYNRNRQWEVTRAGYRREWESPAARERSFPLKDGDTDPGGDPIRHDADNLMEWFMGKDSPRWREVGNAVVLPFSANDPFTLAALTAEANARLTPDLIADVNAKAVGGPLYPPIHGFFYAPLGLMTDPADAYAVCQWALTAFAFVAGFAAASLSRGRVWWPVATMAILLYPGCRSGLDLAQNPTLTLAVVLTGWALAARGREYTGGLVWGLLAFKPVWAAAFLLVPLVMGRWRFAAAMVAVGAGLILATLPFTGIGTWFDWLAVGKEANSTYDVNKNWVGLSRDLHGIPRRFLLDFSLPDDQRHSVKADVMGWSLWGAVVGGTTILYLLRADRRYRTGLGAGFLFLGAFLACYRFMYYDALLSVVGTVVLFADPCRLVRFAAGEPNRLPAGPRWAARLLSVPVLVLGLLYFCENHWYVYQPKATVSWTVTDDDGRGGDVLHTRQVTAAIWYDHPWDTTLVLVLWLWCGWRLAWGPDWGDEATDASSMRR